jgi:hypothetical protein
MAGYGVGGYGLGAYGVGSTQADPAEGPAVLTVTARAQTVLTAAVQATGFLTTRSAPVAVLT